MAPVAGGAAPEPGVRPRFRLDLAREQWPLVAVLAATLLVYLPTLAHWFLSDDFWLLRGAKEIG